LQRRGVEMYHEDDVDVRRMERCRGWLRVWTANILYVCHLRCWPNNNRPLSTSKRKEEFFSFQVAPWERNNEAALIKITREKTAQR